MRIDLTSLVADGFRYQRSLDEHRIDEIALDRSGGVTGAYAIDATAHVLEDVAAEMLNVVRVVWHAGEARIGVLEPARLEQVRLHLTIPRTEGGTSLRLSAQMAQLAGAEYARAGLQVTLHGELADLTVERSGDGRLTAHASKLVVRDLRVIAGAVTIAVDALHVDGARVFTGPSGARVEADSVHLHGARIQTAGTTIAIETLDAPGGLAWRDGRIEAAEVVLSGASVDVAIPPSPPRDAAAPRGPLPDVPALDLLEGHVSVDVRVGMALPVIKSRQATHRLRLPVRQGSIGFDDLEHGLSSIEDALLDFEVENDELILELDFIPLVKFDNVTLVAWPLRDPIDKELARQKRVRLRRLLAYRLPPRAAKKPSGNGFRLLEVALENIAVELTLGGPLDLAIGGGTIRLGAPDRPAIQSLTLRGSMHPFVEGEPRAGRLDVTLAGALATVAGVTLGSIRVERGELEIDAIEPARVELSALSLRSVAAVCQRAHLRAVAIDVGRSS